MSRNIAHHADILSFMTRKPAQDGGGIDNWNVEGTGNYRTDTERGRALAEEYLAYFGEFTTNGNMTLLGSIVVDMVDKQAPRGLIIGFMAAVSEATAIGARFMFELTKTADPQLPIDDAREDAQ